MKNFEFRVTYRVQINPTSIGTKHYTVIRKDENVNVAMPLALSDFLEHMGSFCAVTDIKYVRSY